MDVSQNVVVTAISAIGKTEAKCEFFPLNNKMIITSLFLNLNIFNLDADQGDASTGMGSHTKTSASSLSLATLDSSRCVINKLISLK
jgi:hypothetical protein